MGSVQAWGWRRRQVLTVLGALAAASAWAQRRPGLGDSTDAALQEGLVSLVRQQGLEAAVQAGRLAVAVVDLSDLAHPRLAMLNGHRMMYAASMPKVAILLGALAEVDAGRRVLDDKRRAQLHNMIRYSSNQDATAVLNWVGGERLLSILESPRYQFYDRISGGLWVGKGYDSAMAFRRDPLARLSHGATVYQAARLYTLLAQKALFDRPDLNDLMLDVLSRPGIRHKFVQGLEQRPMATIWRKSGTWKDTHADSALVASNGRQMVMVAIAQSPDGGEWLRRLAAPLHDLVLQPA